MTRTAKAGLPGADAAAGRADAAAGRVIDAVVTHHRDGFRSGVARFNELLAERLAVPLFGLFDDEVGDTLCALLSFKVSELDRADYDAFTSRIAELDWRGEAYLHDYVGLELEREIVTRARRVHCGNLEVYESVRELNARAHTVWTPGLITDTRPYEPTTISVFSFGMAHKIRADEFRRLRALLDESGLSYAVYVSAANHETSSLRDAQIVFDEMHEIFPHLYFLGNLSDVAIYNYLCEATFFAAFFERGVRANNTSVASAMEQGAVVITNLDEFSPPEFVHMENVIDLDRCAELPVDPITLKRLSLRAMETASSRTWDRLVARLSHDAAD